jgi:hypothetical protein
VDNGVAHIEPVPMWTIPSIIHEVFHKESVAKSRYAALRTNIGTVFHVSTAIHSVT